MSNKNKQMNIFMVIAIIGAYFLIFAMHNNAKDFNIGGSFKEQLTNALNENPEIIIQAAENYQKKMVEKMKSEARKNIKEHIGEIEKNGPVHITGDNHDITIVEFFDYSCGYCKSLGKTLAELAKEDKKLKFVFKELPILSENSDMAARSALFVFLNDKNKYYDYHNTLLAEKKINEESIKKSLEKHGFSYDKFKTEMKSKEINKHITNNHEIAGKAMIRGTPSLIINGEFYEGAMDLDSLKKHLENLRK